MNERRRLSGLTYGELSLSTNLITTEAFGYLDFIVYIGGSSSINAEEFTITGEGKIKEIYEYNGSWLVYLYPNYSQSDYVFTTITVTHVPSGQVLEIQVTQKPEEFLQYGLKAASYENACVYTTDSLSTSLTYGLYSGSASTRENLPKLSTILISVDINFEYFELYTSGREVVLDTYTRTLSPSRSTTGYDLYVINGTTYSGTPCSLSVDVNNSIYLDYEFITIPINGVDYKYRYLLNTNGSGMLTFNSGLTVGESGYISFDNIEIRIYPTDDSLGYCKGYSWNITNLLTYPIYTFTVTRKEWNNNRKTLEFKLESKTIVTN